MTWIPCPNRHHDLDYACEDELGHEGDCFYMLQVYWTPDPAPPDHSAPSPLTVAADGLRDEVAAFMLCDCPEMPCLHTKVPK